MKYRILAGLAAVAALWGQPQPTPAEEPGRAARLSFVYGSVSFRPASVEEWTPATLNYPLSTGDHLWTDREAQAEVSVGLTTVHLAPETGFFISTLDDTVFRMGLAEGALNIRIPRMNEGESVEVETPYGKFRLLTTGSYRVDVQPEADYAAIVVRTGAAEAIANGQTFAVAAGKRAVLSGKPAILQLMEAPAPDAWDQWCAERDEQAERGYERSETYVPWEITGAAEFVDNGDWVEDTDGGWCWIPRGLPAGWAPFRFGFWTWRAAWGWTWVDNAPWGFATSHWGRWNHTGRGWAWKPDRRRFHTKYSPHTVAFSEIRGSRYVSWVPLAPGESRPIRNREFFTSATQRDFAASRPIRDARVLVVDRRTTEFTGRTAAIVPTREGILGGRATERPARRPNPQPVAVTPPVVEAPRPVEIPRRVEREDTPQRREVLRRAGEEESRQAEEIRRVDERRRAAEEARRTDEVRRAEETRRAAEESRRQDEARRAAEVSRRQEEDRRQEEHRRAEDNRRQEEARRAADEARRQDDHRRAEESRRAADEARRQEEHRRAADEARRQDEHRRAEESRRAADEARRQEEHRRAEDNRRQEEARRAADESRRQDEARRQDEHRRNEETRRAAEESRRQDEARRQEEHRANEARKK